MINDYHPDRFLKREKWIDLGGEWSFGIKKNGTIEMGKITVPYCPESEYSGISYKDFVSECVYERTFSVPERSDDECVILHFGAVDHEAKIYINCEYVGRHLGGYTPFSFDITDRLHSGENVLKVKVYDDVSENVPSGKQSEKLYSFGCFYTRCTGIWQTVWLEIVPKNRVTQVRYYADVDNTGVDMEVSTTDAEDIDVTVLFDGRQVGKYAGRVERKDRFTIQLNERHLWQIGEGNLYDVIIKYGKDRVESYFGLRSVKYEGKRFLLNGRSVYQRLVLDQGYYKGGVYTPKTRDDFKSDIERATRLGFNGLRLHQKVFDPEYLYYCDKMGVMVWGEFPSWGVRYSDLDALGEFVNEWTEVIERDFNHPSIITWCPLNEVWADLKDSRNPRDVRFVDAIYAFTKSVDETRPCVDVSGGHHGRKTDLYDFHSYGDNDELKRIIDELSKKDELNVPLLYNEKERNLRYNGNLPVHISEFGGKKFTKEPSDNEREVKSVCGDFVVTATDDWGYGKCITSERQFAEQYDAMVKLLFSCDKLCGFCYTQLYDVEQEQNGFYTYDRVSKFSEITLDAIKRANQTVAAVEKEDE